MTTKMTTKKGIPKRDGSGRGTRANQGRSGCKTTSAVPKGRGQGRRGNRNRIR